MAEIRTNDEVTRDWDWFAVDDSGAIGHFTTAGLRKLPTTVKTDDEAALRLISYFGSEAPKQSEYIVQSQAELDSGTLKDVKDREWYLRSFIGMASAGLFSYDTYTQGSSTDYFLVACPKSPLRIHHLPPEIRQLVMRTRSTHLFAQSPRIAEVETKSW